MNLIDAMRAEYWRSKRWLFWGLIISLGLYVIALANSLVPTGWPAKTLVVVAATAQIVVFACRYFGGKHSQLGEEIRRLAMLQDGLGLKPSKIQLARLRERVGEPVTREPDYLGPYYESETAIGPTRLLEITEESAFFSECLAKATATVFGAVSVIGLLIVIIAFAIAVQAGISPSALETGSKFLLVSMAYWATGDLFQTAVRFHSLGRACERVVDGCSHLLGQEGDVRDKAHALVCEYHCAIVQAPPIPTRIYKCRQDRINRAWRERRLQEDSSS